MLKNANWIKNNRQIQMEAIIDQNQCNQTLQLHFYSTEELGSWLL